ncbi:chromatin assembly factor 1 subunit A-domain-containing protein [Fomitopsis serialis]|uniref:chromatin assembly factor 1 subunit A-domain-containing protein n=1 Tax=Fomitopsis serialis TaxID=139415 RepID=UPI002008242D|nr:chromatin assembly factor 1 subunit A-domain-containing protein [Neoantrodia serialis]KAH9934943.1 chromatin assembly factor 1 subunit A-domain-containing protein [Neoantrodia serialis]
MSTSDPQPSVVDLADAAEKSNKTRLVDLKNGKLVLRQKLLSLEKMSETMQDTVKFREFIEARVQHQEEALSKIPDDHLPLIVKLVHESDKTVHALAKHIQGELLPVHDADDIILDPSSVLPLDVIEQAIKAVATRNDYGLESTAGSGKVPAALHIWRWEAKDKHMDWLPRAAMEKLETRLAERRQAKQDVQELFDALPEDVRSGLLGVKSTTRTPLKTKPSMQSTDDITSPDQSESGTKGQSQTPEVDGDKVGTSKGSGRSKKPADPEKAAREREKLEKKAAKAEREKREQEAQSKSRSIMANFFGKGKATPTKRSDSSTSAKAGNSEVAGPSTTRSDFAKTFKPFVLKKGSEIAPVNWFEQARRRQCASKTRTEGDVIVLDDVEEDALDAVPPPNINIGQMDASERLHDILSQPQTSLCPIPRRRQPRSHLKSYTPCSVRFIMTELTEAEVTGDDDRVRALLAVLRNRRTIPAKVLIFTEDARPGYFGTWTRSSREIGPRAPFGRDVLALDYSYDSAEEWEGEEENGGDDVVEDADDEEVGEGEGEDSDLDDWLVDDDEVEDPGTPVEERRDDSPDLMLVDAPYVPSKRKTTSEAGKQGKKRKVVIPLVPFTKGPCWESSVGRCSYEPFEPYRIELFNDTSYPIDPFTYVAAVPETSAAGAKDRSDFAVPALPSRLAVSNAQGTSAPSDASSTSNTPVAVGPKKPALTPKTMFPEAHLPVLLSKINTLATSNLAFIVETVYQDLREQRVKKNAIEAKVKEVGEKSKSQKIWIVKPEVKAVHGLA